MNNETDHQTAAPPAIRSNHNNPTSADTLSATDVQPSISQVSEVNGSTNVSVNGSNDTESSSLRDVGQQKDDSNDSSSLAEKSNNDKTIDKTSDTNLSSSPSANSSKELPDSSSSSSSSAPTSAALTSYLHSLLMEADLNVVTSKKLRQQCEERFGCSLANEKTLINQIINDFIQNGNTETDKNHHKTTTTTTADGTAPKEPSASSSSSSMSAEPSEETQEDLDRRLALELQEELGGRPRRHAAAESFRKAEKRKNKSLDSAGQKKPRASRPPPLFSLSPALSAFFNNTAEMSRGEVIKGLWSYIKEHQLQDEKNKKRIILDEQLKTIFGKDKKTVDMFKMNTLLTKHMKKPSEIA